ncbi:hypothetical protein D3C87_2112820 [compost metagenome]
MVAPVDGLRPSRAGVSFTLNLPNPGMLVSAPEPAASEMCLNTLSTIAFACALLTACSAAILSAISFVVVMTFVS